MKTLHIALVAAALAALMSPPGATAQAQSAPEILLRLDDIGMNHSVNMAVEEVARTGIPLAGRW